MSLIEKAFVLLIGVVFISVGIIVSSVPAIVFGVMAILILVVIGSNDDDIMRV